MAFPLMVLCRPCVSTVLFPLQISAELIHMSNAVNFVYRDCKEMRGVRGVLVISVTTIMSIS